MKKILITVVAFLIIPQVSFGAVTYSRSPSGASVTSPVSISVSFDNFGETGCVGGDTWGVVISDHPQNFFYSTTLPETTMSGIFNIALPTGEYEFIGFSCNGNGVTGFLEWQNLDTIFIVISASSVLFGGTTAGDLMASVGGVSSNVYVSAFPYLLLSVGVFVAFMIVQKLVDMLALAYDQKMGREPRATRKRGRKKKD